MINIKSVCRNNSLGSALVSVSGISTPVLASLLDWGDTISSEKHPTITFYVQLVNEYSLFLYLFLILLFLLGMFLARKGKGLVWRTLQVHIDELQKIAFEEFSGDYNDRHRVTLFKYKNWSNSWFFPSNKRFSEIVDKCWPWSGWLVPVLRSGHTGKVTKSVFWVPDMGTKAEGIAGKCWSSNSTIVSDVLPNISKSSSSENKNKYCVKSNMPSKMLDKYCQSSRPLARHIMAFPVNDASGDLWGVLVFDSMEKSGVDEEKATHAFSVIIEPIGVLLEGV